MARTQRLTRWLVFAPAAALALFTGVVNAEPDAGLTVTVWDNRGFNASPPLPTGELIGETYAADVWHSFDQQPMFNLYEDFVVRYVGNITAPISGGVRFMAQADDGTKLYVGDVLIADDWRDKGGGGTVSQPVQFEAGVSQPFTLWFYENGGGAWVRLHWLVGDQWERVPASAFSLTPILPTTTTELATTTTQVATTTTELATTTTVVLPTTSLPPSTSTAAPTTTETSTITTVYQPTSSSSVAIPSTTSEPIMATTSSSIFLTTTTVAAATTTSVTTTTSTLPPVEQITQQEAIAAATNAAVVAELTSEQAVAVFDAIDISELDTAAAAAIVAAVQDAPTEVREAFEQEIDVFSGATDNYIPLGSTVNVATRRVLVVSCAFLVAMPPVPVATRRR